MRIYFIVFNIYCNKKGLLKIGVKDLVELFIDVLNNHL